MTLSPTLICAARRPLICAAAGPDLRGRGQLARRPAPCCTAPPTRSPSPGKGPAASRTLAASQLLLSAELCVCTPPSRPPGLVRHLANPACVPLRQAREGPCSIWKCGHLCSAARRSPSEAHLPL